MSLPLPTELWRNIFLFLNSNLSVYVLFAISSFDSTHVCRCLQTAIESVCELKGFDSTHVCRCLQTWTRCTLSRSSLIVPTFVGVCKRSMWKQVQVLCLIVPTFVGVCKRVNPAQQHKRCLIVPTFVGVCKPVKGNPFSSESLIVPTFVGVCKQGVKKPTLYGTFGEYFY